LRALDEVYVSVSEKWLPTKPRPDPEDRELLERALSFYHAFPRFSSSQKRLRGRCTDRPSF
jgi:hypothetical protein